MARKPEAVPNYLVFISHSTKDRWIARQLAALIEQKGKRLNVKAFLDAKDIEGGDSIHEAIRQNLRECDELVVLLSPYSINRPWVLIEVGAAWALGKRVIAIIDKVTPQEMPDILSHQKALDLNEFDEYLEQLLARARGGKK